MMILWPLAIAMLFVWLSVMAWTLSFVVVRESIHNNDKMGLVFAIPLIFANVPILMFAYMFLIMALN